MDCDTCGSSWAEGARVTGAVQLEFEAVAHCYGGINTDREDVYKAILAKLGYEVVEKN